MTIHRSLGQHVCRVFLVVALVATQAMPAAAYAKEPSAADEQSQAVRVATDATGSVSKVTVGDSTLKGTGTEDLPITMQLTYTLDGKSIAPTQLAGTTGHLVLRVDYQNNVSELRRINGVEERIYTPFVCFTVAMLDADVFHNVSATNARVIEDKGGIAVVGYALPGLRESLDLDTDEDDFDIPTYMQLEADVTDFALDPLYTIVTPELLGDVDTSDIDLGDLDDMGDGTSKLREAMGSLVDGSGALGDALRQEVEGSRQVEDGIVSLREALNLLPSGTAQLASGAQSLASRLGQASSAATGLQEGAEQLESAAQGAQQQLAAAQESTRAASAQAAALARSANALAQGDAQKATRDASGAATSGGAAAKATQQLMSDAASQAQAQKDKVATDIDAAKNALEAALDAEGLNLTDAQKTAILDSVTPTFEAASADLAALNVQPSAELAAKANELSAAATQLEADASRIESQAGDVEALTGTVGELQGSLSSVSTALGTTGALLDGVEDGAHTLSGGAQSLAGGLSAAENGASSLANGIGELGNVVPQVLGGVDTLAAGSHQLTNALSATADGAHALTSGMKTFNDEGIAPLADTLDGYAQDLDGLSDRLDALRDAANAYDSFAGITQGKGDTVRFIYKTERIG